MFLFKIGLSRLISKHSLISRSNLLLRFVKIVNFSKDWILLQRWSRIELSFDKSEFKNLLSLATQESYFIFNDVLYKQKDGAAMGSPLGPTMANAFFSFYEIKWLEQCPKGFKPVFYRRYVDGIFVLWESAEHLSKFRNYFNTCHPNMSFSFEQEKNGKLSFLDIEVSREKGKFVMNFYRKPTFSGVYTHFESFLPTIYKFDMVYTLAYRCFKICSDWTKFHEELSFLKQVFLKSAYPLSFIDNSFKTFVDKLFIERRQLMTVEKKTLFLSLPYLGETSLQTRTKLRKSIKGLLNSCKLQIVFKRQRKLSNAFCFKDRLPSDLVSGVVYKYTCGRCNSTYYGKADRHLKVRSGEHIGISPLTFKKTKPAKESPIRDHLLNCNNIPSFEKFTILANRNNKFNLEIKESLLIKQDRPILNKNITSTKLFLFDNS